MNPDQSDFHVSPATRLTLLGWALASFLVTYAGPFGTYELPIGRRAVFWSLVVVCSTVIARIVVRLARYLLPPRAGILAMDLTISALMVILFTPLLYLADIVILGEETPSLAGYARFLQYVAIISIIVCLARRLVFGLVHQTAVRFSSPNPDGAEAEAEADRPRLARRLPTGFDGSILRLTVDDHFVDVITETETFRIRLRFTDAVDEMDAVQGYCTHRSHWVAEHAVAGVKRDAGKIWLELVNGDLVPVSRKYRPELEGAGVI